MESDPQLRRLLREWNDPVAPPSLEARVLAARSVSWWRYLLTGSIRVPVPVGVAMAIALLVMTGLLARTPKPAASAVDLTDFQVVEELRPRIVRSGYEH